MKAIALFSGGLDSILAVKLIQKQGVEVIGLKLKTPFLARENISCAGIDFQVLEVDISEDILDVLRQPRYGFGANINPCIDCKIAMLRRAGELMRDWGAQFIVTGDVLGQRPMSQYKKAMEAITKRAGLEGLVLRPLSANLLPETVPEKEGWIQRDRLLGLSGRSRREQMKLAKEFGIRAYFQPAGGCLLTNPHFAARVRDLLRHKELNLSSAGLLKSGRYFRLSKEAKLVVGRNERENEALAGLYKEGDILFTPPDDIAGPVALGRGVFDEELIKVSCRIICRYCDLGDRKSLAITCASGSSEEKKVFCVQPLPESQLAVLRV